jgi:hypothetical protein
MRPLSRSHQLFDLMSWNDVLEYNDSCSSIHSPFKHHVRDVLSNDLLSAQLPVPATDRSGLYVCASTAEDQAEHKQHQEYEE